MKKQESPIINLRKEDFQRSSRGKTIKQEGVSSTPITKEYIDNLSDEYVEQLNREADEWFGLKTVTPTVPKGKYIYVSLAVGLRQPIDIDGKYLFNTIEEAQKALCIMELSLDVEDEDYFVIEEGYTRHGIVVPIINIGEAERLINNNYDIVTPTSKKGENVKVVNSITVVDNGKCFSLTEEHLLKLSKIELINLLFEKEAECLTQASLEPIYDCEGCPKFPDNPTTYIGKVLE